MHQKRKRPNLKEKAKYHVIRSLIQEGFESRRPKTNGCLLILPNHSNKLFFNIFREY